jgi:hypothetical protein
VLYGSSLAAWSDTTIPTYRHHHRVLALWLPAFASRLRHQVGTMGSVAYPAVFSKELGQGTASRKPAQPLLESKIHGVPGFAGSCGDAARPPRRPPARPLEMGIGPSQDEIHGQRGARWPEYVCQGPRPAIYPVKDFREGRAIPSANRRRGCSTPHRCRRRVPSNGWAMSRFGGSERRARPGFGLPSREEVFWVFRTPRYALNNSVREDSPGSPRSPYRKALSMRRHVSPGGASHTVPVYT